MRSKGQQAPGPHPPLGTARLFPGTAHDQFIINPFNLLKIHLSRNIKASVGSKQETSVVRKKEKKRQWEKVRE